MLIKRGNSPSFRLERMVCDWLRVLIDELLNTVLNGCGITGDDVGVHCLLLFAANCLHQYYPVPPQL